MDIVEVFLMSIIRFRFGFGIRDILMLSIGGGISCGEVDPVGVGLNGRMYMVLFCWRVVEPLNFFRSGSLRSILNIRGVIMFVGSFSGSRTGY